MKTLRAFIVGALVVSLPVFGQPVPADAPLAHPQPDALEVSSAVVTDPAGTQHTVTGGVWLSEEVNVASARRQVALAEENKKLREELMTLSPMHYAIISTLVIGAFGLGVMWAKTSKP